MSFDCLTKWNCKHRIINYWSAASDIGGIYIFMLLLVINLWYEVNCLSFLHFLWQLIRRWMWKAHFILLNKNLKYLNIVFPSQFSLFSFPNLSMHFSIGNLFLINLSTHMRFLNPRLKWSETKNSMEIEWEAWKTYIYADVHTN